MNLGFCLIYLIVFHFIYSNKKIKAYLNKKFKSLLDFFDKVENKLDCKKTETRLAP